MNRVLLLAMLSLVLTFSPDATTWAGSIVYNIQNYASLQNGYTLSGTITTDGTIGTLTSAELRRFLQRVFPRGFHKVRYCGLWNPSKREQS
jgi:Putative transposase